jgi:pyruvate/2-oxoglutarate dehydrogenase complex dihydrolipoamide dehydrogenase (E3) component
MINGRPKTKVSHKDGLFKIEYGDDQGTKKIEADQLLVATGVQANCDRLGVEKTGIELTDKGMIKVPVGVTRWYSFFAHACYEGRRVPAHHV